MLHKIAYNIVTKAVHKMKEKELRIGTIGIFFKWSVSLLKSDSIGSIKTM